MDDVVPTIKGLSDDPTLKAQYETWSASRSNFNQALADQVPEAVKQGWQKNIFVAKSFRHRQKKSLPKTTFIKENSTTLFMNNIF